MTQPHIRLREFNQGLLLDLHGLTRDDYEICENRQPYKSEVDFYREMVSLSLGVADVFRDQLISNISYY